MWAFIHFLQFLRRDKVNNYKLIAVQLLEIVSNMYWRMGKQKNSIFLKLRCFFGGFMGFLGEAWGAELFLQLAPWLAAIVPPLPALWQFESKVSDKKRWPEAEILAIRWPENLERMSRGKFRKCRGCWFFRAVKFQKHSESRLKCVYNHTTQLKKRIQCLQHLLDYIVIHCNSCILLSDVYGSYTFNTGQGLGTAVAMLGLCALSNGGRSWRPPSRRNYSATARLWNWGPDGELLKYLYHISSYHILYIIYIYIYIIYFLFPGTFVFFPFCWGGIGYRLVSWKVVHPVQICKDLVDKVEWLWGKTHVLSKVTMLLWASKWGWGEVDEAINGGVFATPNPAPNNTLPQYQTNWQECCGLPNLLEGSASHGEDKLNKSHEVRSVKFRRDEYS